MGHGLLISSSTKNKLNTKSSTETEIVDVDGFMPDICRTQYFIAAQGYNVKDKCLHHDNKSSIILENNGKASSAKMTKRINIWYFFITNKVNNGEVSIVWCPTWENIGYYMIKTLQCAMFRNFRYQTMGVILAADMGPGKVKVEHLRSS